MEDVKVNNKIELEFSINTSPNILFNRLSTPSGLAEWFADDVNLDGNIFTFVWNNSENKAELVSIKENKYVRFRWVEDGNPIEENAFFEFRIASEEITGGLVLHVTEVILDDDIDDAISLWNYQIGELKRNIGV